MWSNCKVIKTRQPPPHFYINPPFQVYAPFLVKTFLPLQVTQFLEGAHPPSPFAFIRTGGRGEVQLYLVAAIFISVINLLTRLKHLHILFDTTFILIFYVDSWHEKASSLLLFPVIIIAYRGGIETFWTSCWEFLKCFIMLCCLLPQPKY